MKEPIVRPPEFQSYELKQMSRVSTIKIGKEVCSCSIINEPLTILINQIPYRYTRSEVVGLFRAYDFIETIRIDESEYFLYYLEHPSGNDTLG